MTKLTKQVRVDEGNHAALERLKIRFMAELGDPNVAHNAVITEALGALMISRPDLAPVIAEAVAARQGTPAAVAA